MASKTGLMAFVVLVLLLAGCAPSQRELMMERDLGEMKRRLAEVEQGVAGEKQARAAELEGRLADVGRRLADQQAAHDALRVELQALRGRLDDIQRQGKDSRDASSLALDDLGLRVAKVESTLEELAQKAAAPPPPPASPPPSPQMLYDRGRELVNRQEYVAGRNALEEFLKASPQSELAPNARYWIGESYYGEKKYQDAILEFQDVMDRYGDHPKAAAAMYKQGLAFHAMGDLKNARVVMRKVLESYARSDEAKRAQSRLEEWDKGEKSQNKSKKK